MGEFMEIQSQSRETTLWCLLRDRKVGIYSPKTYLGMPVTRKPESRNGTENSSSELRLGGRMSWRRLSSKVALLRGGCHMLRDGRTPERWGLEGSIEVTKGPHF